MKHIGDNILSWSDMKHVEYDFRAVSLDTTSKTVKIASKESDEFVSLTILISFVCENMMYFL